MSKPPDILVIGARRSGTTSLYNLLGMHPKIKLAANGHPKREIHYFDRFWDQGRNWYFDLFKQSDQFLTVDKTPTYLQYNLAPIRAFQVCPNAKIIVSLRHPVNRALSDYYKRRKEKHEKLPTFREAVQREITHWSEWESEHVFWMSNRHLFGYLNRSHYLEQVQRWLMQYPRDQMYVIEYERFFRKLPKSMYALYRWLGLEPVKLTKFDRRWQHVQHMDMAPMLRRQLNEMFRPEMMLLEKLLDVKFSWRF